MFSCYLSANLHPSLTLAFAHLQPLTLKTGPNWPKYASFIFPKGLAIIFGEDICRIFGAHDGSLWGHAHWRPKRPKAGTNGSKRGKGWSFRGARRVKTGPKLPKYALYTFPKCPRSFLDKTILNHFLAQHWPRGGSCAVGGWTACHPPLLAWPGTGSYAYAWATLRGGTHQT